MSYAVVIAELDYLDDGTENEINVTIVDYKNNLDEAIQAARYAQRQRPDGYVYKVIELGTIYTV